MKYIAYQIEIVLYQIHQHLIESFKLLDQPFTGNSETYINYHQLMLNHYMHIPSILQIVELTKIMCQTDQDFIEMFNKVLKGFHSMKKLMSFACFSILI